MRIVTARRQVSPPLKGVPEVWARGQGGLHDVVARPRFRAEQDDLFLLRRTHRRRRPHRGGAGQTQRRQRPARRHQNHLPPGRAAVSGNHYGCRIVQAPTATCSSRWANISPPATRRRISAIISASSSGSRPTARCPPDNPFVGRATPNRNLELRPSQPRGSRSIPRPANSGNRARPARRRRGQHLGKGKNYGWPVIGYGIDYSGAKIHESTPKDGMEQPIKYWVPSIAPSGHGVLYRKAVSGMERQPVHRRAGGQDAGAADSTATR